MRELKTCSMPCMVVMFCGPDWESIIFKVWCVCCGDRRMRTRIGEDVGAHGTFRHLLRNNDNLMTIPLTIHSAKSIQ